MIRVLVAEDSETARALIVALLRADPDIAVVGEAADGLAAVELTKQLHPHVVTMDIRMPKLDGFDATHRIMIELPTPIVIVSAIVDAREVEVSMRALEAGALAVQPKPPGPTHPDFADAARAFVETIKAMSQVKVVRRWPDRSRVVALPPVQRLPSTPEVLAIAASTGGPAALALILAELPAGFPLPILVVQHIAGGFTNGFASWLGGIARVRVRIAVDDEPLESATVLLAPEDHHLAVEGRRVRLSSAAPVMGFRPSASVLFESVATHFGPSTIALMLTGMGHDGVEGLRAVRAAGGRVLVQDEGSSIVFGMPGAAIAAGLADVILPLSHIAGALEKLT